MAAEPILALKDVVAGYGQMTILNGTTFSVARDAITTIIGPNGAGKSTVFKTVFGLLRARSGTIRLDGRLPAPRAVLTSVRGAPRARAGGSTCRRRSAR